VTVFVLITTGEKKQGKEERWKDMVLSQCRFDDLSGLLGSQALLLCSHDEERKAEMLDTLTQIGAYRVSYFSSSQEPNPLAFGFYIRGEKAPQDVYSRDAKTQLYAGLFLIHTKLQIRNLRGLYVDVDSISNLMRPAYLQLKRDLINGFIRRVFILDESALFGAGEAEDDLRLVYETVGGFDLFVCQEGECVPVGFTWNK
jgi:hypothetical protein